MTLVEFLRARLDEDVEHAESARTADWENRAAWEDLAPGVVYHARHFDPARMLTEIDAKRRILARVQHHANLMGQDEIHGDLLRLLALPYASHPDYRDEWRPA